MSDDTLQEMLAYARIDRWHAAGYDGRGVTIASWEDLDSDHGRTIADILRTVAPGATIIARQRPGWRVTNGHIRQRDLAAARAFYEGLIADGVNICTLSSSSAADDMERLQREILLPAGIVLFAAAGNEDEDGLSRSGRREDWISVGACELRAGRPVLADYSSAGEELDLCGFCPPGLAGTSFSSPWVAAMTALWWQWYREELDDAPSRDVTLAWLRANAEDLGDTGHDARYGWGLLRLPEEIPQADSEPEPTPTPELTLAPHSEEESLMAYPIEQDLLPLGRQTNRPGTPITVRGIVSHRTANRKADARAHREYFGSAYRAASAHAFVDSERILQIIPWEEMAWHAGSVTADGWLLGSPNGWAIGIELCEDHPYLSDEGKEAWRRYVWLHAYLCAKYGLNPRRDIYGHFEIDPVNRSVDPIGLFAWDPFIEQVASVWEGMRDEVTPEPPPEAPEDLQQEVERLRALTASLTADLSAANNHLAAWEEWYRQAPGA